MTSKKSYKEIENEKTRGRKRYLERLQEQVEADAEIDAFVPECIQYPENDEENKGKLK